MIKAENTTYIAPRDVASNARLALDVRESKPPSQRGMTAIGLARARQLANREPIRVETIRRMVAYFSRHEIDKEGSTWTDRGKGWQAWHGWGGDEGWTWARGIIKQEDEMENKASRRHSEADMNLIRSTRKMATKIISTLSELGDDGADDNYDPSITPISDMSAPEMKQLTPPGLSSRQEEMVAQYQSIALDLGQWSQGTSESGAHYAPESPYDDEGIKCEHCVFYMPDTGMCQIVSGNINPEGICKLWIIPENVLVKYALEPIIYIDSETIEMAEEIERIEVLRFSDQGNKQIDTSDILEITADVKNYARWLMGRNEVGS